ncbi:MAG TPA: Hsp20 family protein [Aestuariivirga sp.]|jgi:HSP20 family molecular chaperone IbpA|nr:Hsp20 family protein [Aestuariivirga sp.]
MTRISYFSSPLLLGFDSLERLLDRAVKTSGEGYPPYNIERFPPPEGEGATAGERLRITIAVAGFSAAELEVTVEDNQLTVKGRQRDEEARDYLHRGIAGRQFQRAFVLADGMEVTGASLAHGLLAVDLRRLIPERVFRHIAIREDKS